MKKSVLFVLFGLILCSPSMVSAQWEPTNFEQSAWDFTRASNGNLLVANDIYPDMGGLYLSEDEGETWVKTTAGDFAYSTHLVKNDNVYFGGVEANIAISHDNGLTWSNTDFSNLFSDITDQDPMYAIEYHNGRIYASVFGLGVGYSEDEGITWTLTDIESMWEINNPEDGGQWTYNLASFNDKLYNIGAFGIWVYDEAEDLWTKVDGGWYGSDSTIVGDTIYISYNAVGIPAGIRYTTDFQTWEVMPLPDGMTTSVQFLKYYEGAFFMGHTNDAIFYTLDHGATWIDYREDYPFYTTGGGFEYYGVPMNLVFSEDTMFCGIFSPFPGVGGVYKAPIPSELMGINEISSDLKVLVYPNPASDVVSFQFTKDQKVQGTLNITDATGRTVYSNSLSNKVNNTVTVSVKSWSSGLYFYTLVNGESKTSGKFLVR